MKLSCLPANLHDVPLMPENSYCALPNFLQASSQPGVQAALFHYFLPFCLFSVALGGWMYWEDILRHILLWDQVGPLGVLIVVLAAFEREQKRDTITAAV